MSTVLARSRRHGGLLVALLVTSAVVTALAVGTGELLERRADDGVRGELAERSGDDLALRLALPLAHDANAQDAAVRGAIEGDFAAADIAITVSRTVEGGVDLTTADGFSGRAQALSVPDFGERAELVAGAWPAAAAPTMQPAAQLTMQADAASALGLGPGAIVELHDVPFELTGTWRVRDGLDPRWTDARLIAEGSTGQLAAAVVIAESDWALLPAEARASWSIVPHIRQLTIADLSTASAVWSRISASLRDAVGSLSELDRDGQFTRTADEIEARMAGLNAIEPVALLLIGALALATLGQLARLLALEREDETRLLWSRGASSTALAVHAGLEALVMAFAGAALGSGLPLWAGRAAGGDDVLSLELLVPGAIVAAIAGAFAAGITWNAVHRLDSDRGAQMSRQVRTASVGLLVLLGGGAVVTTWQLQLYDSPFTPDSSGELSVDPVTGAAPALALIALVLGAAAATPVIGRMLDRPGRGTSVVRLLAVRTVARRAEGAMASVVILAIAVAMIVVAAGYSASWSLAFDRTAQLRAGADLAAIVGPPGVPAQVVDAVGALPEVSATAALHVESIRVAGEKISLVAVTPDALRDFASPLALPDADAVAELLRTEVPGPMLPAQAERIALTAVATGFTTAPTVTLQLADTYGVLRPLELELEASAGLGPEAITYSAAIPRILLEAPGPLQVLALDLAIGTEAVPFGTTATWALQSLRTTAPATSDTELTLEKYWAPNSPDIRLSQPVSSADGLGFDVASDVRNVRLTPAQSSPPARPLAVSQAFAERTGIEVGDSVVLRPSGNSPSIGTVVVAILAAVPSAPDDAAVLIDLGIVRNNQLLPGGPVPAPRLVWLSAAGGISDAAASARELLPAGSVIADADERSARDALGGASIALWVGAAGCAVLSLVTVAASVRAQRRGRRGEVALLRALGADGRQQGAIRGTEIALTIAAGGLGGLIAGAVVVLVAIGPFARAAVPGAAQLAATPLAVDPLGAGVALFAVGLGLGAIALTVAARVRRDARSAGGEVEP